MIYTKDTPTTPPKLDTYATQELAAVLEGLCSLSENPYIAHALAAGAYRLRELEKQVNVLRQTNR